MKFKTINILVIFAIILRIVLSVITYHSDLGAFALAGKYIVGENKWLSFYDTIASKNNNGILEVHRNDMVFNYQPLAYLIPSVIYLPFKSIINQTGDRLINKEWINSTSQTFNLILLLYKLPMILADLGILWLLPKFFKKYKNKIIVSLLWAFNPVAIYVSSMMGQVDIIIALFILISLYFAKKQKIYYASIFVALSALIKPIGLILIPIYAIYYYKINKKIIKSILVLFSGLFTYIIGIFPYISSASYRHYALFAEQINKSTFASISIASGHEIPFFFIALMLIIIYFWSNKINLTQTLMAVLLSSLAFTHFHPQWLVWIMPIFVIISIKINDYFIYLISIMCWFLVLFNFDSTLHLQMFLHSQIELPKILTASNIFKDLVQVSRAGIVAILIWLFTISFKKKC